MNILKCKKSPILQKLLLFEPWSCHFEIIPSFVDYINTSRFEQVIVVANDKGSILDALYSYRPINEWPSNVSIQSDFKDVSPQILT